MSDLDATLAAIDAATGCQQCGGSLDYSSSLDFCSPKCMSDWHEARVEPLVDYREPWQVRDLPGVGTNAMSTADPDSADDELDEREGGWTFRRRWTDGLTFSRPLAASYIGLFQMMTGQRVSGGTEWHLPAATGNLAHDRMVAQIALATAMTDLQRREAQLRLDQLALREAEVRRAEAAGWLAQQWAEIHQPTRDVLARVEESIRAAFLVPGVDAVDEPHGPPTEETPAARALRFRRQRNTGPAGPPLDPRRRRRC